MIMSIMRAVVDIMKKAVAVAVAITRMKSRAVADAAVAVLMNLLFFLKVKMQARQ
jgi:hypothetical protein